MKVIRTQEDLDKHLSYLREKGNSIGFVPTMGALHDGHLSLIKVAHQNSDKIVVSIFVNPTQFAPHEDFDSYPRDELTDGEKLKNSGVDVLFLPTDQVLYPSGYDSNVKSGRSADGMETTFRPHFFDGVVNVVSRLFNAVKPDTAVFGEKDFQQLQVIKEMVESQNMPINVIGAPIIRDEQGLALSSRNEYLSNDELKIARKLNKILKNTTETRDTEQAKDMLISSGFDKVDYIEERWGRLLTAAWIGKTRLIDNIAI
ncbi:MAG: pantoate--beta-alanine ligase [Alphaproteobacteria bacterium]